MKILYRS